MLFFLNLADNFDRFFHVFSVDIFYGKIFICLYIHFYLRTMFSLYMCISFEIMQD